MKNAESFALVNTSTFTNVKNISGVFISKI